MRSPSRHSSLVPATSVAILVIAACTAAPPEPVGSDHATARSSAATVVAVDVPGYQHALSRSKFQVGTLLRTFTDMGWQKTDGADGIFSVNLDNGAARAISHVGSPQLQAAPYGSSLADHNQHVLDYFVGCGIPRDQIASVQGGTILAGSGPTTLAGPKLHLRWYTSSLERAINGIPVIDSIATARFNANDRIVSEAVYWPPIPKSVVSEAEALRTTLSNAVALAALQAALPPASKGGRVVIRHRGMDNHRGSFGAVAAYDVVDGQTIRHFDASDHEVKLPWE